jgi:signal transduction histidine kinase
MTSPLLWNITALFPAAAFLLNGFVWTYVFALHNKSPVNRAFLFLSGDAAFWIGHELLPFLPIASGYESTIYRLGSCSWILTGYFFLEFANAVTQHKGTLLPRISLAVAVVMSGLSMFTNLLVKGTSLFHWGPAPIVDPVFHTFVSVGSASFALYGAALIVGKRRRTADTVERKIFDLILGGAAVSVVSIFAFDVVLPNILNIQDFPRYGSPAMAIFMLVIFYAVMKYRFLSISLDKAAEGIFKDVKVGILLVDRNGTVHRANKQSVEMFGSDMLGKPVSSLFLGQAVAGEFFNREIQVREGGIRRVFSISSSNVSEHGRLLGSILMLQDVTDQKNAEEVLRKSRDDLEKEVIKRTRRLRRAQRLETIGTLAGGIAHDFNNSLAAVLGFTKAAYHDLPDESPIRQDLDEVILAANRGRDMVRRMMSLARQEDKSDFKVTDIISLLNESVGLLRISTPPNIIVRTEISIRKSMVNCSATQLTQVITNLYNNACHAMKGSERGELTILLDNIEITEAFSGDTSFLKNGTYIRLVVKDTGMGIRDEHLPRIFDPFFTTKGRGEGTGLGLSSAQVIIQNHDGEMTVESELNVGTSFSVYLPVHSDSTKRTTLPSPSYSIIAEESGGERILWVDDEPQMTRMGKRTLSQLGYRVTVAESGREALHLFKQDLNFFDLVITDYNMPGMTGCDLAKMLKDVKSSLPIILLSGLGDAISPDEIEQSGIAAALNKPVPVEDIGKTIRSILDR